MVFQIRKRQIEIHSQKMLVIKTFENTILVWMPEDQKCIQKSFEGHGLKAKKFCYEFKLNKSEKSLNDAYIFVCSVTSKKVSTTGIANKWPNDGWK